MRKIVFCIALIISFTTSKADEGMWVPTMLKYKITDMQAKGFKLSANDLYNVNGNSYKDAIVHLGGCTGEMISEKGLMLTNHHCGLGQIQYHSSIEHNYIEDGFWAKSFEEELHCPGMTAGFAVKIEDITTIVLAGITDNMPDSAKVKTINENKKQIERIAKETDSTYTYSVSSMFNGNQYLLFTYEVFTDVRLVGAPPASIGKFGGDTDNWMWPRHTGDFSLFRIYAGKNNKPAAHSQENIPYTPKKHFKLSIADVKENDFTLIYGFPGRTNEYLPSHALQNIIDINDPLRIKLRDIRLNLMNEFMMQDPNVRIKYTSKSAGVANAWKKWQGELKGLKRLDAVKVKQNYEKDFATWVKNKKEYTNLLPQFEKLYTEIKPYSITDDYYREAFMAIEVFQIASSFNNLVKSYKTDNESDDYKKAQQKLKAHIELFYKNYHQPYDIKLFGMMVNEINTNTRDNDCFGALKNTNNYVNEYKVTIFADKEKAMQYIELDEIKLGELETDFFYKTWFEVKTQYDKKVLEPITKINNELAQLQQKYMAAQVKMDDTKLFYPDANSTLRVAYGKVKSFKPKDGVTYDFYTTIDGLIEKSSTDIYDYKAPERLVELWKNKDYGKYADNSGKLRVAFIASNHTTGGNSGSPVLDAHGNLIGLNFDRCWESTMSDYMFDPDFCRNISVSSGYILFIIDKFAGASNLINEITVLQ